jgi:hypothetical protein
VLWPIVGSLDTIETRECRDFVRASHPAGIDDAAHRRREASLVAPRSVPAAYAERSHWLRQRRECGGSPEATRRLVNKAFLEALAEDFRQGGPEAIAKVRKYQPAAYMKICALLVPREMKLEHSGGVKAMSDEQLERSIELLQAMIAQREAGANAKVVEGEAVPSLPPPVSAKNS